MEINVIIPTLNEADNLRELLPFLKKELAGHGQVIVADGGSEDVSKQVCEDQEVTFYASPQAGRGPQMNAAVAAFPNANVYYFSTRMRAHLKVFIKIF